jgi:hypothetical protein
MLCVVERSRIHHDSLLLKNPRRQAIILSFVKVGLSDCERAMIANFVPLQWERLAAMLIILPLLNEGMN